MFETIITNKTFVEINSAHTMICIQDVWKVKIQRAANLFYASFENQYGGFVNSDNFNTEEEAIEFRNKILKGEYNYE